MSIVPPEFSAVFHAVTGYKPRAYQELLAERLAAGDLPSSLDVPTGMGKTFAVLLAWLYALTADAAGGGNRKVALRLHVVVDRRVVVDDAHRCACDLAVMLDEAVEGPLADLASILRSRFGLGPDELVLEVRRLRGGLTSDLTEHTRNPARPAVVIGTLDMVCSRLLFRGYQLSARRRSIDAALTGLDSWWVLDEAHLSAQAHTTLETLQTYESALEDRFGGTVPGLRVMAMSATPDGSSGDVLTWDAAEEERRDPVLARRRLARDAVHVTLIRTAASGARDMAKVVTEKAAGIVSELGNGDSLVVFCTTVADAKAVWAGLRKPCRQGDVSLELLTGGMPERFTRAVIDRLEPYRTGSKNRDQAGPVVVVATSTLEVGADLDFTHLVTQSCGADSLVQRLGRVNRVGARQDGSVTIVHATGKSDPIHGDAAGAVAQLIADAPVLGEVVKRLREANDPAALRRAQQVPVVIPPTVLRAYLRTIGSRNDPPVTPWIRELTDPRAEVTVVVRDHADLVAEGPFLADLEDVPPDLRAEGWTLRMADMRDAIREALKTAPVIVLDPVRDEPPRVLTEARDAEAVHPGAVLVIDSRAAESVLGTDGAGKDLSDRLLMPGADLEELREKVEAEASCGREGAEAPHVLLTDLGGEDDAEGLTRADTLRELIEEVAAPEGGVLTADVLGEDSDRPWLRLSFARPAKEESLRDVPLEEHNRGVGECAQRWARVIGLPEDVVGDITAAGAYHDAGKAELSAFQAALRMNEEDGWLTFAEEGEDGEEDTGLVRPLAKSALPRRLWRRSTMLAGVPWGWRHEAASARVLDEAVAAGVLQPYDHELVRYLVLAHHGFYRGPGPVCLQNDGVSEPYLDPASSRWAAQIDSFHRLNRRCGPYGLALAEAVLRLADWEVSRKEQEDHERDD